MAKMLTLKQMGLSTTKKVPKTKTHKGEKYSVYAQSSTGKAIVISAREIESYLAIIRKGGLQNQKTGKIMKPQKAFAFEAPGKKGSYVIYHRTK